MSANSADGPARVEVVLVKAGRMKIRYPADLLADDGTRVSVRAPWAGSGVRDFGFVRFEPGDVFTEHYWRDRWYSVIEFRTAGGVLMGQYCDITPPADLAGGRHVIHDHALDLCVAAHGTDIRRLDEDEFAASGLLTKDPEAAAAAVAALDELDARAREGGFGALLA